MSEYNDPISIFFSGSEMRCGGMRMLTEYMSQAGIVLHQIHGTDRGRILRIHSDIFPSAMAS